MLMQIMEEVAAQYDLACLIQEKPFAGVNGSGKHNNWSIAANDGTNLFDPKQLATRSGTSEIFPVVMAAVLSAVDEYGDLMRMSIAPPGNDFRLGACEAPPSIMSVYLGDSMTTYLAGYKDGEDVTYDPRPKPTCVGVETVPDIVLPAEDRNRTSPFPYGGHRFEFRAVGSSQNVSMVNTVLGVICANAFKHFADQIEAGESPRSVAQKALDEHWKIVFNGDGYDKDNQKELVDKGLWQIDNGIEAMKRLRDEKNMNLFEEMKVLSREECVARSEVMFDNYTGVVDIEVRCMIDMINQHVIPAIRTAGVGPLDELKQALETLEKARHDVLQIGHSDERAVAARTLRLETMVSVREVCDKAEAICPAHLWTLSTYKEMLFCEKH